MGKEWFWLKLVERKTLNISRFILQNSKILYKYFCEVLDFNLIRAQRFTELRMCYTEKKTINTLLKTRKYQHHPKY